MSVEGQKIFEQIEKVVTLPSIPHILFKIQAALKDLNAGAKDVADLIMEDPAITFKVLRIANSAYYGLRSEVSSVSLAVTLLGFKVIRNIVLTAVAFDKFNRFAPNTAFDSLSFWKHSIFSAVAAKVIGSRASLDEKPDKEDFYISGLLHDIGKIIMLNSAPGKFQPILEEACTSGYPLHQLENEHLGFNHAFVGAHLANKWHLPENVSHAIRFHHEPGDSLNIYGFGSVSFLADRIAKWIEGNFPETLEIEETGLEPAIEQLAIPRESLPDLMVEIEEKCKQVELPLE